MPDFLEERISGLIRMGASYVDDYAVDIVQTSGGQEFRRLIHPFQRASSTSRTCLTTTSHTASYKPSITAPMAALPASASAASMNIPAMAESARKRPLINP